MLTAFASVTAAERLADFDLGQFETLRAPGFEVDVQNCDGTPTLVDLLPLPRPLSHRYADNSVVVAAWLERGRPGGLEYVEGDRQLLSALSFPLQRSRYADVEPHCVLLRVRVTETTLRAAETVAFHTWVDVTVAPDGNVQRATVVDPLPELATYLLLEDMEDWRLPARQETVETSVFVNATLMPNGEGDFEVAAVPEFVGPRPRRTWRPRPRDYYVGGDVVLEFDVDEKGRPRDIQVVHSNADGLQELTAVAAMRRWRYTVVTVGGEPVPVEGVRQRFRYHDTPRPPPIRKCNPRWDCLSDQQLERRKQRADLMKEARRRSGRPW